MSTKLKHQTNQGGQAGGNVVQMPTRCASEGCNKKVELQNFCKEHYEWFKFGLITKEGKRPIDFDKKYQSFLKTKQKAA